ncbi:4-hydroxybenzoate octaprenyltransferase, partial [Pectobacterium brasiliense]|nr:4-hydroxybenzoate octaprenyltransferase [Pectobacterium brasiliense]
LLLALGIITGLGMPYTISLLVAAGMFVDQQVLTAGRERDACFKAFHHNKYAVMALFIGVMFGI